MKTVFMAAVLLALAPLAWAQDVQRIEIVEHGVYTVDKFNCQRDSQGIERCDRGNIRHAITTWTIPAQLGIEFGLRYRVVGTPPGAPVAIDRVWLLPGSGFHPPGANQPIMRLVRVDRVVIGGTTLVSYGFDDPWELVPGTWVLRFSYRGRVLSEQRFNIVRR